MLTIKRHNSILDKHLILISFHPLRLSFSTYCDESPFTWFYISSHKLRLNVAPGRINLVQQVGLSVLHAAPVLKRELRCNHEPLYQFSFTCRGNDLDWATENSLADPTRENWTWSYPYFDWNRRFASIINTITHALLSVFTRAYKATSSFIFRHAIKRLKDRLTVKRAIFGIITWRKDK